jgi:ABC-2 type transport system permease protein
MPKIITILVSEYLRQVKRRAFLGALFIPLVFIAIISVVMFVAIGSEEKQDQAAIGYTDPANALAAAHQTPNMPNKIIRFASEADARAALEKGDIAAWYAIHPDFAQTGSADLFYWKTTPPKAVRDAFADFARSALIAHLPAQTQTRLLDGVTFSMQTPDGERKADTDNPLPILFPMFLAVGFIMAVFSGAQYLLQAVVDEKANRTIEIVVSSVTPTQLMVGKIVGLALVGLTQVGAWAAMLGVVMALGRARLPFLDGVSLPPQMLVIAAIMFVLQYLLLGSLMAAIGSAVIDQKDAQSANGPVSMLAMAPMFFIASILIDPNGLISTVLSILPFTSPLAMLMRVGMTSVPFWQIALSIGLMALAVAIAMWLAGKVFRMGMLEYGKSIPFLDVIRNFKF